MGGACLTCQEEAIGHLKKGYSMPMTLLCMQLPIHEHNPDQNQNLTLQDPDSSPSNALLPTLPTTVLAFFSPFPPHNLNLVV